MAGGIVTGLSLTAAALLFPRKFTRQERELSKSTCQSVIPVMEENKYGRIINIASTAGITGGSVGPQYGMSKAGVIALTQSIGRKYAGSGILTNCVAPGDMDTEMVAALFPTEEAKRKRADKIPTGAIAKPEEVARLIAFLASERTTYITGETYRISGGRM